MALYEDEMTVYNQPTHGYIWSEKGRFQPKMNYSHQTTKCTRIIGVLNVFNGAVRHKQYKKIDRYTFACFLIEVGKAYAKARKIYIILDNWPVHFHPDVYKKLANDDRIELVPLPTYSPWLNKIERLWHWVRQHITHAHSLADAFDLLKKRLSDELTKLEDGSEEIMKYTGLMVK